MENNKKEIFIAIILVVLLVLLNNPFSLWMPSSVLMTLVVALAVIFAVFAGLLWRERARDEREEHHRANAGRIAFLAGTSVLVLGIVIQSFQHNLDVWLVYALGVMLLSKIFALIYSKRGN